MTPDLIERLNDHARFHYMPHAVRLSLSEAKAEIERLREALEPFARAYDFWSGQAGGVHDDNELDDQGQLRVRDLREARAALQPILPSGGDA